jgi:hypothetical protein
MEATVESVASKRARLKARQGVKVIGLTELDVVDADSGVSVKRHRGFVRFYLFIIYF